MAKKETAEEKLLKIIEASKKAKAGVVPASVVVKKPVAILSIGVTQVNYALFAVVFAGLVYFGKEIVHGISLLNQEADVSVSEVVPRDDFNSALPQEKNLAYYLDLINIRDIFKPYEKKQSIARGVLTGKAVLEEKMKKYKLVGVAWLDVPESATVMMEDLANGFTRFLREGDKIEDVTIKTIYTDRVVVGHENEEMVIKL